MNKHNINPNIVDPKWFLYGLNAEMEHKNIIHNDPDILIKIVIAHLEEYPDYYQRLSKLEEEAKKYWKNKNHDIYL